MKFLFVHYTRKFSKYECIFVFILTEKIDSAVITFYFILQAGFTENYYHDISNIN